MNSNSLLTLHRSRLQGARLTSEAAHRWLASGTALGLFLGAGLAQASTFSVINNHDSGAGSLREAIVAANANAGADTIQFNIPGPGVKVIQLASALPPITDPVIVNGYNPETPTLRTEIHRDHLSTEVVVDGVSYFGLFSTSFGWREVSAPLAVVLDDTSPYGGLSLAGDPLPPGSLTGKIALISRGIYQFDTKISNVQNAGAVGMIVVNREEGGEPFEMGSIGGFSDAIPGVMVRLEDRTALMSKDGKLASLTPPAHGLVLTPGSAGSRVTGLVMSGFAKFGILVQNSASAAVDDCVVRNNYRGGIENYGMLTLTRSALSFNSGSALDNFATAHMSNCASTDNVDTTTDAGAGIYNSGTLTVENSIISGNTAADGGGILNIANATMTLINCTVTGNNAVWGGGIQNAGEMTITGSRIIGNSASSDGGGLYTYTYTDTISTTTIVDSVINENRVDSSEWSRGGGIFCEEAALSVSKCNVHFNQANGATALGGAIYFLNSTARVEKSNINDNRAIGTALGQGGGIYAENTAPTIVGTRVNGNKASTANDNIFVSP